MRKVGQYTLATALVAGTLLFAMQPAHAHEGNPGQVPRAGGLGSYLLFHYWTTEDRDTYLSIDSPGGVMDDPATQTRNVVRVIVRSGDTPPFTDQVASVARDTSGDTMAAHNAFRRPPMLAQFDICLMPGDTWTASISANAAGDGSMLTLGNPGECDAMVTQPAMTRGGSNVMRTPTMDNPTIMLDGTMGIIEAFPKVASTGTGEDMATSTVRDISGLAYLVSAEEGFASTYNPVALTSCNVQECNAGFMAFNAREEIKRHLFGRWITDPVLNATTDVILTFPDTHPLNYQTVVDNQPRTNTDPLTMYVFDEAGNTVANHEVMLDQTVNMCRFEMMENRLTQVTCNDVVVIEGFNAEAGSFRIVNNTDKKYAGDMKAMAGTETGTDDMTMSFTLAAQTYAGAGTVPLPLGGNGGPWGLPVFGFTMSAFDVTSGMYDNLSPIRWHTGITPP